MKGTEQTKYIPILSALHNKATNPDLSKSPLLDKKA